MSMCVTAVLVWVWRVFHSCMVFVRAGVIKPQADVHGSEYALSFAPGLVCGQLTLSWPCALSAPFLLVPAAKVHRLV